MINLTTLKKEKEKELYLNVSEWKNICVDERLGKGHYIAKQGEWVISEVNEAFEKIKNPSIFIISPFKSVVDSLRELVKKIELENVKIFQRNGKKIILVLSIHFKERRQMKSSLFSVVIITPRRVHLIL